MTRITIANVPRWRKMLTRKRARSGSEYDEVAGALLLAALQRLLVAADEIAGDAGGVGRRAAPAGPRSSTGVSSPCFSTCGGRPGEKIRSLMPCPNRASPR